MSIPKIITVENNPTGVPLNQLAIITAVTKVSKINAAVINSLHSSLKSLLRREVFFNQSSLTSLTAHFFSIYFAFNLSQ